MDHAEVRLHLPQAVEAAIGFVQKHSLHSAKIGTVRRQERWNLPPAAVREAIINAVAHADYVQRGAPIRVSIFDRVDQSILDALAGGEGLTTGEIAKVIALSPRATRTHLAKLVKRGLVREIGASSHDPKRSYFRVG